jgi:hypothetical protein
VIWEKRDSDTAKVPIQSFIWGRGGGKQNDRIVPSVFQMKSIHPLSMCPFKTINLAFQALEGLKQLIGQEDMIFSRCSHNSLFQCHILSKEIRGQNINTSIRMSK